MKKIILIFLGVLLFIGILTFSLFINKYYISRTYYLKLVNPGIETKEKLSDTSIKPYEYTEQAFDENGNKINVKFYSYMDHPLEKNKYFSILYQKKKGVIAYQEISENSIPKKALDKIKTSK